jgi:hypothetical protein
MHKILLTIEGTEHRHWIELDNHTQESFYEEVDRLFKGIKNEDNCFWIDDIVNVPFHFRHAGVDRDKILADRFWDWKDYSEEDKDLLDKYMDVTCDDESTLEEAKEYYNNIGIHLKDLHFKEGRMLFNYINETGHTNCTLEEAKEYYNKSG